jgi:hypothetical protein
MTWKWDQSAGEITHDGVHVGYGYSGRDRGLNNPAMQAAPGVGPIPRGAWKIVSVGDSPQTGKFTIVLDPKPGTDTCGRSAFRIHGDNVHLNHTASHGCIILQRIYREKIWGSGDRDLDVVT